MKIVDCHNPNMSLFHEILIQTLNGFTETRKRLLAITVFGLYRPILAISLKNAYFWNFPGIRMDFSRFFQPTTTEFHADSGNPNFIVDSGQRSLFMDTHNLQI